MRYSECRRSVLKKNPVEQKGNPKLTGRRQELASLGWVKEENFSEKVTSWPHLTPETMSSRGQEPQRQLFDYN